MHLQDPNKCELHGTVQKRIQCYGIRINCESNHVRFLIIQILITTVLAQLVQNTRLMLGLGGYSASVHK